MEDYIIEYTLIENDIEEVLLEYPNNNWDKVEFTLRKIEDGEYVVTNLIDKEDGLNVSICEIYKVKLHYSTKPEKISFKNNDLLEEVLKLDTTHIKNFTNMFKDCINLKKIAEPLNLSNATRTSDMFNNDYSLTSLKLTKINKNIELVSGMFDGCLNLKLSNEEINTLKGICNSIKNVENYKNIFNKCYALYNEKEVDLNNPEYSYEAYLRNIDYPLREIDIKGVNIKDRLELKVGLTKDLSYLWASNIKVLVDGYDFEGNKLSEDKYNSDTVFVDRDDHPDNTFKWCLYDNSGEEIKKSDNYISINESTGVVTAKKEHEDGQYSIIGIYNSKEPNINDKCMVIVRPIKHEMVLVINGKDAIRDKNGNYKINVGDLQYEGELRKYTVTCSITPPYNNFAGINWISSNEEILRVINKNESTAQLEVIGPGDVILTCISKNNNELRKSIKIEIIKKVEDIQFIKSIYEYYLDEISNEGVKLPGVYKIPVGSDEEGLSYKYTLFKDDHPTVIEGDKLIITEPGEYELMCQLLRNGKLDVDHEYATAKVIVKSRVLSVDFDIDNLDTQLVYKMNKGESLKLFSIVQPDNATNKKVTYTTDNKNVAYIVGDNVLYAYSGGNCNVYVICDDNNGIQDRFKLEVDVPLESVVINEFPYIQIGKSYQLKYSTYPKDCTEAELVWTSSNENILKVDQNGKIEAIGLGECTITCKGLKFPKVTHSIKIVVTGNDIDFTINTNSSNTTLYNYLPFKSNNSVIQITKVNGKIKTLTAAECTDIQIKDVKKVKCSYISDSIPLTFKDMTHLKELLSCDVIIEGGKELFKGCKDLVKVCDLNIDFINKNKETKNKPFISAVSMFSGCENLKELPNFNTSDIQDASQMFLNCKLLKSVTLSFPKLQLAPKMFYGCSSLEYIDTLGSNRLINADQIIGNSTSIKTISNLKLGEVSGKEFFKGRTNLISVEKIFLTKNLNAYEMFNGCSNLSKIPSFYMSTYEFINCTRMFNDCKKLTGKAFERLFWGNSNIKYHSDCFKNCVKLSNYYNEIPFNWGGGASVQSFKLCPYTINGTYLGDNNWFKKNDKIVLKAISTPSYAINKNYSWSVDSDIVNILPSETECTIVCKDSGTAVIKCINKTDSKLSLEFTINIYNEKIYTFEDINKIKNAKTINDIVKEEYNFIEIYDSKGKLYKFIQNLSIPDLSKFKYDEVLLKDVSKIKVYYM